MSEAVVVAIAFIVLGYVAIMAGYSAWSLDKEAELRRENEEL
jgi:hypothetical protein